jgi:hypothetical protein
MAYRRHPVHAGAARNVALRLQMLAKALEQLLNQTGLRKRLSEQPAALTERGLAYSAHHAEPIRGEGRQLIDKALGIYRYDQLFVLRFNAAPAVLLEAGIIVNCADEVVLASPEGQARIGAGRRRHRLVKWRLPEKGV